MDTRTKIVSAAELAQLAGSGATVVSGYFDPMTLAHADRLKELKDPAKPLLIVVTDPPDPILPGLARAHLLAGLAVVDHVAVAGPEAPVPAIQLEAEDAMRLEKLIAHVHARQSAAQ